jgi:twitching motility two-component system response regulator PilG
MTVERRPRQFAVTVLGTNRALHTIVVSLCRLYRYRDRIYRVVPHSLSLRAHIVIVDADDPAAVMASERLLKAKPGKAMVFIGADCDESAKTVTGSVFRLRRTQLSANLLKTLNAVTVQVLKYVPELVVDDNSDPQTSPMAQILAARALPNGAADGKVLVVDDSLSVRTQLELCLRLHDLEVDLAPTAEEALELAGHEDYELIFLDIVLPEMDGYKACKMLRAQPATRVTPVIMLTGKASTFNRIRGAMAGCDCYITKPVDAEELKGVLTQYIPGLATA